MLHAGGYKKITQRDRLREGVDIVIGTPGRLNMFVEEGELKLHSTQFVVLDEVDILLGDASLFAEQASTSDISAFVIMLPSIPWLLQCMPVQVSHNICLRGEFGQHPGRDRFHSES